MALQAQENMEDEISYLNQEGSHLTHLQETFDILKKYNKKLNLVKWAFGVGSGIFFGFLVSQRGIEVNPDMIKTIENIPDQLKSVKEVQRLTGRMSASVERPKKVLVQSSANVQTEGGRTIVNLFSNFGSCSECSIGLGRNKNINLGQNQAQVLADFSPGMMPLGVKEAVLVSRTISGVWTIFTDGASNIKGEWSVIHIPMEENVEADALANLGSSTKIKGADSDAVVQLLHSVLDVDGYCEVNSTILIRDWRNEFVEYLRNGKLSEEPKASRALRTKDASYCLVDGQLYQRSFQGPLARCFGTLEADYVMRESHEGICENHSGADSLVLKLIRAGYYCPRMEQDTKAFVQKCDKCQSYAQLVHQPA
nr:uncharacterized protein LOC117275925 [Nicotiana tomentosiformis]